MKNKIMLFAVLTALNIVNIGQANAVDVSSWSDLKSNSNAGSIIFQSDINATGEQYPMPINFSSAEEQTIDGNYHSFSSDPYTGAGYYSLSINNTATLNLKNFGKYAEGSADSNTFSYTDLNSETKYVDIQKSVNSFSGYFLTLNKPITVNITNSVFADNGKDTDARLIYGSFSVPVGGTINVADSIFYNNTMANAGPVVNGYNFKVNIDNSIFYGNKNVKSSDGGAVKSDGTITIKDSYFVNNTAATATGTSGRGGAVYFNKGNGHTIENTKFEGNTAGSQGGAIYLYYTAAADYIKNSEFIGNTATSSNGGGVALGGGYLRTIENVLFDGNTSGNKGGGLYVEELWPIPDATEAILVKDTTFSNNTAKLGGGMYFSADYDNDDKFTARIVDSDFTSNSATQGGGLYIINGDAAIISAAKDVIFSGNTATDTSVSNAGDDIYFKTKAYAASLFFNAAADKKIVFDGTIATTQTKPANVPVININQEGITYSTYEGETETVHDAGTTGEIQFNNLVGDENGNIANINLYGGTLSIGQNETNNASTTNPDGYINNNNFYVKGNSTLNTVNNVIGQFAPNVFEIEDGVTMDYMFDVDLANTQSDTIAVSDNNGTLQLSSFNVITDSDAEELKIKYSDTNVNGIVKDGYTITTSTETYNVTAENDDSGSYVVFAASGAGSGLPAAIKNESDQYIITDGEDENVAAWLGSGGNVIKSDIDINGNGYSIYTESGIDGIIVSSGTNVIVRNVNELTGFDDALTNNGGTLTIIDSNVVGNTGTADVTNNGGTVNITAENKDINIGSNGNTTNAIASNGGTINANGSNSITFNGDVTGTDGAQMKISTAVTFNGNVSGIDVIQSGGAVSIADFSGADYTMNNGTLNLNQEGSFAPETFNLNDGIVNLPSETAFSPIASVINGGIINAANGEVGSLNFNSLTLNNVLQLAVDVDANNGVMDTISASSFTGDGQINVNSFNLISGLNKPSIDIYFADDNLRNQVSTDVSRLSGKIYRYDVNYDSDTGMFTFRGGGSSAGGYSPSVLASPVATQVGGYLTQIETLHEGFFHMERYTKYTLNERKIAESINKYALADDDFAYQYSNVPETSQAFWVKPYTTFEKVSLKGGVGVSNIAYGSLFGGDSQLYDLNHDWKGVISAFIGYNGSHQSYSGISMNQQGGVLGMTATAYKGGLFTGLTVSAGASAGEAYTPYGTDNFSMLTAGIANKTGYNFEFNDGKIILQPSLFLGYTFVNTFDYTNAAGVSINNDPLNSIQIIPGLRVIGNLKNGWKPYTSASMVWNVMDTTHVMANDVRLPQLSVKPYVEYGVGVQKSWGEEFTAFGQTMIRNGGRNGVALTVGFRWLLGRSNSTPKNKKDLVLQQTDKNTPRPQKSVIKILKKS